MDIALSRGRNTEIVKLLLDNGGAVTSLHKAVQLGDPAIVKAFLKQGADINAKDEEGMTPLHLAAKHHRKDIFDLLIANGADVNAENKDGQTPKDITTTQSRYLIFFICIVATPLVLGVILAIPLVRSLRRVVGQPKRFFRYFALLIGICFVEYFAIVAAIAAGLFDLFVWAFVSVFGPACVWGVVFGLWLRGRSPARKVLKASVFVSLYTSLAIVYLGVLVPAAVLIEGVSITSPEEVADSPLASLPWPLNTILGFSVTLVLGAVLLKTAIITGEVGLLIRLRNKSAVAHAKAIIFAAAIVLAVVFCVHTICQKKQTLHEAARKGDVDKIKALVAKGVNISTANMMGATALHAAAGAGHRDVVELLLDSGADINAQNNRGRTPLDLAVSSHPMMSSTWPSNMTSNRLILPSQSMIWA